MTTRTLATTLALLTVTGAAAFLAGRALATGAPVQTPLTYGGVVTDKDGKPYPSAQDVSLAFYDKADATVPKCTAPTTQAEAGTGRFSVVLPGECAQAVHDAPDLWTEATVGAGKTILPRTHVGAVPYALEADSAKQAVTAVGAGGALKSQLDGLASDVAGLKAGSGSGGGVPWVVDAKGVKLGTLVGYVEQAFNNNGGTFGPSAQGRLQVSSATGFLVDFTPNGAFAQHHPFVQFAGPSCTGNALLVVASSATLSVPNRRVFYFAVTNKLYAAPGPAQGVTGPKSVVAQSYMAQDGTCAAGLQNQNAVILQEVAPKDIGLPPVITPPLTIQP
jgi:hypothetical protein